MNRIRKIAGLSWAVACAVLLLFMFPMWNRLSESAARLPFMKINPNFTGGEVAKRLVQPGCTLDIRTPVFDGLIGERKTGFVQLDWRGKIMDVISDTIDYNFDSIPDFGILIDTRKNEAEIVTGNEKVKDILISTPTSYGWAARVRLVK